ncbi:MAG: conjugal transfer protein [Candidatus Margulisbacteria bacterium]|nr:conjugal transfer protein [Candidatus Margulisiibacteriota bacterium]
MIQMPKPKKTKAINPFLNSRREWNEVVGDMAKREHFWRLTALMALSILFISIMGNIFQGTQAKLKPYIVEVDKLGNAVATQYAEHISTTDDRIIKALLARFIVNIRSVMVDATAQKRSILSAYGFLSSRDPAIQMVNEYFKKKSPFQRAKEEIVAVEISSVLPISKKTWQIEWVEIIRSRGGIEIQKKRMKAAASIKIFPPEDERMVLKNPIGLYIENLNWSQQY